MLSLCLSGAVAFAEDAPQKDGDGPTPPRPHAKADGEGPRRGPGGPDGPRGPGEGARHRGGELLSQLDLTDDQKAQIKAITEEARADMEAWREANKEAHEVIMASLREARENQDREAAEQVMADLRALRETAPDIDIREKIHAVLTDAQKAKLKELAEARHAEMEKRREEFQKRREAGEGPGDGERRGDGERPHRRGPGGPGGPRPDGDGPPPPPPEQDPA
jgi:Spy/CpxP family protein refolding chaperone